MSIRFGLGQSMRRVEDMDLITGQGRYTDDMLSLIHISEPTRPC